MKNILEDAEIAGVGDNQIGEEELFEDTIKNIKHMKMKVITRAETYLTKQKKNCQTMVKVL